MPSAADIDDLFISGYVLTAGTATAPCDPYGADVVESEDDGGGTQLGSLTLLVRTSAFPDMDNADEVQLSDDEGNERPYVVQGRPVRIQDGQVMQVSLQAPEEE